jgi:small subunit ribosomal protein S20
LANHKSALKRLRQNEKRRVRNKGIRTSVRRAIKLVKLAVEESNNELARETLASATREIRKAGSHGIYHAKNVSRKVSRLTKLVNKLEKAG